VGLLQSEGSIAVNSAAQGKTLLVVGAGPKGLAIAAKQAVLRRLGIAAPDVVLLDRHGVAAHWSGAHGYTDGRRMLGTGPEKDIGFPYDSRAWGDAARNRAVDRAMLAYSWQAYLVDTYRFATWIDRDRVRPTHGEWAAYLQWVGDQARAPVVLGELCGLGVDTEGRRWRVRYQSPGAAEREIAADGVVLTGPGRPLRVPGQPEQHPRVLDGATVWPAPDRLAPLRLSTTSLRIGVIGTGETAAAASVALLDSLGERVRIDILVPRGVFYSRDEGYEENRLFSDPDPHDPDEADAHQHPLRWLSLTEEDRREFVRRADRGVFSVQAVREITRSQNVRSLIGAATSLEAGDDAVRVTATYDGQEQTYSFDYVVVARGFDPLWFLSWLDEGSLGRLRAAAGALTAQALEAAVGYDLAVEGLLPRLHVPMLSGVAQGPGFPNLSCLGLLAERVLAPYAVLPPEAVLSAP
jgi:mycobactin lysine-N-oxygenase